MPSPLPRLPNDFIAIPLLRPATKSYLKETTHYLYLRPNAPRIPTDTTNRELFLANLPIDTTPSKLKSLFSNQLGGGGRIEEITIPNLPSPEKLGITKPISKKRKISHLDDSSSSSHTPSVEPIAVLGVLPSTWEPPILPSASTAILRFIDEPSAALAYKAARQAARRYPKRIIEWDTTGNFQGPQRYKLHQELRFPDRQDLKRTVDEYMAAYYAKEEEKSREYARRRQEPDEDGFVTVTRGGRNGVAREEDVRSQMEELKKRDRERVGGDFYRFQNRERKKEVARDLVRGFEEDVRRVEEMRRRRGGRVRPEP